MPPRIGGSIGGCLAGTGGAGAYLAKVGDDSHEGNVLSVLDVARGSARRRLFAEAAAVPKRPVST
eukprot:2861598-Rhodomonas_salina.3